MTENFDAHPITQFLFGLMLLFASATLLPGAVVLMRKGNPAKGVLYIVMGAVSLFLMVVAFLMAFR